MFKPEVLKAIQDHAVEDAPAESCGVVISEGGTEVYVRCRNLNGNGEEFKLSAEDWADAEERGEILAIVHSHPDESAEPSELDLLTCEEEGVPWIIVSVRDGKVEDTRVVTPTGWKAPLVGRSFFHGVLDCYTLIRDWYSREAGISLPDFERADDWWAKGENLYVENFEKAGFRRLKEGEPVKEADVLLMQVRAKVPNHAGVYIGDSALTEAPELHKIHDAFLHHLYGRLSTREVYGGYWKECTTHVLRHKEFDK